MGNWSGAPHADLQSLLESKEKRRDFLSVLERNGLSLAALNCSGNQLHPVDGERQSKVVYDTLDSLSCSMCIDCPDVWSASRRTG